MAHQNYVSLDDMRGQLLTLDTVREKFAMTEPLSEITFAGDTAEVRYDDGWASAGDSDYTSAHLMLPGGREFQLTKQAALEAGAHAGIPRKLQQEAPADALTEFTNRMLARRYDDKDLKALTREDRVVALVRATVSPFSNQRLLDVMLAGIAKRYGNGEVLADYKFHHDLELTALRLIVPSTQRVISGTAVEGDTWNAGLNFRNSLTGGGQTELDAYLFRWWCTNGCTDTLNASGKFARRGSTEEDVLAWAAEAVDDIFAHMDEGFEAVQALTTQPVTGDVVNVWTDLAATYGLPVHERRRVIDAMADSDEMTMYGLQQAVTQAANEEGLGPRQVEQLMQMGGHIAHVADNRCTPDHPCRRLLPAHWHAPVVHGEVVSGDETDLVASQSTPEDMGLD